ncbi:MAG: 50S ribosomal protein L10 [Bdellovibrionaceae bacterium]|nr:50S ribosomal protein L10 [Pseudobdellovibrionaceae bacterium]
MMTRADKAQEISQISERFARAKAAFLVDFKGLTVEEVTSLRKQLHPLQSEMRVVRNTLARRALMDHPESESALKDQFVGTNAIVFAYDDVSAPAKLLADFSKDVEELQVKSGVMDGTALDEARIKYLATLPSKEQLRAQFLGLLQAPMGKFVRTLEAVPGGFARVLSAYKDKQA